MKSVKSRIKSRKPSSRKKTPPPTPSVTDDKKPSEKVEIPNSDQNTENSNEKPATVTDKTVDFVIVYQSALTEENYAKLETFMYNLEQKGFELNSSIFSVNADVSFIQIHVPVKILLHFAEIFGIELAFQCADLRISSNKPYRFMSNDLNCPAVNSPIFQRAKNTLLGRTPKGITNAEKALIIYKVLSKNEFGEKAHECGIEKLINRNIVEAAYPLHDGPWEWTEQGPLNDRQLLAKYWSSLKCWYKQQPLDLIERYFGPEAGFYFAWVGFYNRMLIPAAITGVVFFILGMLSFRDLFTVRSQEVCHSEEYLCPRCIVKNCKYVPLNTACTESHLMYLFDNPLVVVFAALMSIWATVFLELWHREESLLQIRWNLRSVQTDCSMRPEFEENAKYHKVSPITGKVEPYVPKRILFCRYTVTFSVIVLMALVVLLAIFAVMVYRKAIGVVLTKQGGDLILDVSIIAAVTGSIMSVVFILLFEFLYEKIALWLTKMENPRTQIDFDNSFTYKSYAIAFVNNYCVIFYIAFLKARFYTYPGDQEVWTTLGGIRSDLCDPPGCLIELGIQLSFILVGKNLLLTAKQYLLPRMQVLFNKFRKKKLKNVHVTLQWECDYFLNEVAKYQIMIEYMEMIIQYGFVTFFVAAFPLAPLLALGNNLIELRVDAQKMTHVFRRPVAQKVPNIAAWNGILQGVTYVGVATNAFVIAFTSEFVQRTIYRSTVEWNLQGYLKYIVSEYNVSEFAEVFDQNITVCYYTGQRYPPDHPRKYELTDEYWYILTIKFLVVVVFEHVIMLITGIIAYAIPDVPFSVRELINHQKEEVKKMKLKALEKQYQKEKQKQRSVTLQEI